VEKQQCEYFTGDKRVKVMPEYCGGSKTIPPSCIAGDTTTKVDPETIRNFCRGKFGNCETRRFWPE
jgi:hypothetical protein